MDKINSSTNKTKLTTFVHALEVQTDVQLL